jgi:hypothetical protein
MRGEWAIRRFAELSPGLAVELTAGPSGVGCEWSPGRPRRPLTKAEIRRYRDARDVLLGEVAARLGGDVLLIEI